MTVVKIRETIKEKKGDVVRRLLDRPGVGKERDGIDKKAQNTPNVIYRYDRHSKRHDSRVMRSDDQRNNKAKKKKKMFSFFIFRLFLFSLL